MTRLIAHHPLIAKTTSYALMHFCVAVIVAYLLSGSWVLALSIGLIEPMVQTVAYSLHERGWQRWLGGVARMP